MTTPPEEAPDTVTVPRSVLGNKKCEVGEILRFKVVDVDDEGGDVEVVLADSNYNNKSGGDPEMDAYPMET
jgi:hypothetical protein